MKLTRKYSTLLIALLLMTVLGGCNSKKDDELVLVTTEAVTTETTEATTEAIVTEETTESALGRENSISFEDICDCNMGDTLLSGGVSYGMNTIYYSGEEEVYSEYEFLGFDSLGMYSQIYEDSDGSVEILDAANNYWYIVKDNQISVLVYPESLVAAAIIESNHNSMIFGLNDPKNGVEKATNRFRRDGRLIVETKYDSVSGESYMLEYTLDENWRVEEYYCYDMNGEKISYSYMTSGATYEVPEQITQAQAMEQGYRTINIVYVDGEQTGLPYYTPLDIPVELSLIEYEAYSDQECTTPWKEIQPDENGVYMDVTIYMKKPVQED